MKEVGDQFATPWRGNDFRTPKERLVADLACRWWYVLPDWPVHNYARYHGQLSKMGLRKVEIPDWEWAPDVEKGKRKVFELGQFKGIFRDSSGKVYDLRDKKHCPSYTNFMMKSETELRTLLIKAYENQLKALAKSARPDPVLESELKARQAVVKACAKEAMEQESKRRRITQ